MAAQESNSPRINFRIIWDLTCLAILIVMGIVAPIVLPLEEDIMGIPWRYARFLYLFLVLLGGIESYYTIRRERRKKEDVTEQK
jgi:hypothetical protein